jgi:hypothetical protein
MGQPVNEPSGRQPSEAQAPLNFGRDLAIFFPGAGRGREMAKAFPVLGVSILFLCLAPANIAR